MIIPNSLSQTNPNTSNFKHRRREHPFVEEDDFFAIWDGNNHVIYTPFGTDEVNEVTSFGDLNIIPYFGYLINEVDDTINLKVLGYDKNLDIKKTFFCEFKINKENITSNKKNVINVNNKIVSVNGYHSLYSDCDKIILFGMLATLMHQNLMISTPNLIALLSFADPIFAEWFYSMVGDDEAYKALHYGYYNIEKFYINYNHFSHFYTNALLPVMFPVFYDHSYIYLVCPNFALAEVPILLGKTYMNRNAYDINLFGFGYKSYNTLSSITYLENRNIDNFFYYSSLNPPFLFKKSNAFGEGQTFFYDSQNSKYYNELLENINYRVLRLFNLTEFYNSIDNIYLSLILRNKVKKSYYSHIGYIVAVSKNYNNNTIISYPNLLDYDSYYDIDLGISCELVYDINNFEFIDIENSDKRYKQNINIFMRHRPLYPSGYKTNEIIKPIKFYVNPKTKVSFFNTEDINSDDSKVIKAFKLKNKSSIENLQYKTLDNNELKFTKISNIIYIDNEIPYYVNSIYIDDFENTLFTLITFSASEDYRYLINIPLEILFLTTIPNIETVIKQKAFLSWLKILHYIKTKEPRHRLITKNINEQNVKIRLYGAKYENSNLSNIQLFNEIDLSINSFTVPAFRYFVDGGFLIYELLAFNHLILSKFSINKSGNKSTFKYINSDIFKQPYIKVKAKNSDKIIEKNLNIKAISNFELGGDLIKFREKIT